LGNDVYKNITELKGAIKHLEDLETQLDDFDWDNKSDEEYEDIENEIGELDNLNNIKTSLEEIDEAVENNKGKVFYTFSYSDENGTFFSIMEHGGIWGDLKVYVESFH